MKRQSAAGYVIVVLVMCACEFKPKSRGYGGIQYNLTYRRDSPAHVIVGYEAIRDHDLQQFCTYLVAPVKNDRLTFRGLGYLPYGSEHCFVATPVAMPRGQKLHFNYTFPGKAGWFSDPLADMEVVLRIKIQDERGANETRLPFD